MNREEIQDRVESAYEELAKALEAGKSETLIQYLKMCSRFHQYSLGNCILIYLQKPDATFVAGYRRWLELHRFVKKGEKGIAILAPLIRKRPVEKEGRPAEKDEKAEKVERSVVGFRSVFVFDLSQTDGEELPQFAVSSGEPGELIGTVENFIRARGITLTYEPISGGANGMSAGGSIVISPELSPPETFRVLVHEAAHELLHQGDRRGETSKSTRELEAEAVAFIVASAFGIDSSTRSSDYIQLYNGDKEGLVRSLDIIQKTATTIIESLHAARKEATHALAP
ncbi:MAG: ArdC-like ssDNA-binding domain-containing protein [Pirellulales bacterium]